MTSFKKDMATIQQYVGDAFTATGSLVALADGGAMSPEKLQQTLERTLDYYEQGALALRTLCEQYSPGVGGYGKRPLAPTVKLTGNVAQIEGSWLHITLNSLLPHCRYQTPRWLADTLRCLLDDYERKMGGLPYYPNQSLLIIEEYSDVEGRHVYDQDNKGWKAISNVLKGRLIPDDDQYTLGVVLLSTKSLENCCHITLIDARDAADFFALHSGDYRVGNLYDGI